MRSQVDQVARWSVVVAVGERVLDAESSGAVRTIIRSVPARVRVLLLGNGDSVSSFMLWQTFDFASGQANSMASPTTESRALSTAAIRWGLAHSGLMSSVMRCL